MKIILNILILVALTGCCKNVDNFAPEGSLEDNVQEFKLPSNWPNADYSQISFYQYRSYDTELRKEMKKNGINHFSDSNTCNFYMRKFGDSSTKMNGFDFKNYLLVPIYFSIPNYLSHSYTIGKSEFQLKAYINHNSKLVLIKVNYKKETCDKYDTRPIEVFYQWVAVPKLPYGYSLILDQGINKF